MGLLVIVAYRPKKGKDKALLAVVRKHVRVLRAQGLATARPAYVMRSKNGTLVEVFEWKSATAVSKAHRNPAVLRLWKEFEAACTYVSLGKLPEAKEMFASFTHVAVT